MLFPLPADAPLTPADCTTVQLYVVPVTAPESAIDVVAPEHIACDVGVATTSGVGFTVITTMIAVPVHPLADGVMV